MLLEDQRNIHEELERLEEAMADRLLDEPQQVSNPPNDPGSPILTLLSNRDRLARDHDAARFLRQIEERSSSLLSIYKDVDGKKEDELRNMTLGDPMASFDRELAKIKAYHDKYPNQPVENLEKAYKRRSPEDQAASLAQIHSMFTGEEGFGRFFDLTTLHEQYLNLPVHQQTRRLTYLQYLDLFDSFAPPQVVIRRNQKMTEPYFQYLKALQDYLEGFMRRTRPLENLNKLFSNFDKEFDDQWANDKVPGWEKDAAPQGPTDDIPKEEGIYCSACQKTFAKETVYEAHLAGKKHKKAVQSQNSGANSTTANGPSAGINRLKERAVAEREFRIRKLAAAMQTERSDTKVNVERKQGMTERERQQELEQLFSESYEPASGAKEEDDNDDAEDKIYNPLKLPLAWDGKPIPFWLYKLHGLGVEFPCEICGNYVYMGRRAFDKHFNEPRHIHGLKCLGITNTTLFREIISIEEAQNLWKKIQQDQKKEKLTVENVVQMEDTEGNVMPEKVYRDLEAQGML